MKICGAWQRWVGICYCLIGTGASLQIHGITRTTAAIQINNKTSMSPCVFGFLGRILKSPCTAIHHILHNPRHSKFNSHELPSISAYLTFSWGELRQWHSCSYEYEGFYGTRTLGGRWKGAWKARCRKTRYLNLA